MHRIKTLAFFYLFIFFLLFNAQIHSLHSHTHFADTFQQATIRERTNEWAGERIVNERKPRSQRETEKIHKRHAQSWIEFNGSRIFSFSCTFSSVLIICFPLFRLIFPVENVTVIHRMQCPRASYRLLHKKTSKAESKRENIKKHTQKRCCDYCYYSYCCNDRPTDRRMNMFHLLLNFRRTMIRRF